MKANAGAPRYRPPIAAIKLGQSDRQPSETRYGRALVAFMRSLAVLWFLQGVLQWYLLLSAENNGVGVLDTMSSFGVMAIIFFCVADFIAAVGLWLAGPWGGVVWLVSVAAQWGATIILPGFFAYDIAIALVELLLVAAYFALTYMASRERAPYV